MVKNEIFLGSVMTIQSTPIELNGSYWVKTYSVTLPGQYIIFNEVISRRWDVGIWTGLGWPRIGTGGGRL